MHVVFVIVLLSFLFGMLIYNTIGDIYTWFDHCGWKENSNPNKKAKIQNITSEKIQYVKNKAKLKTKVIFSDGFYFVTYKTDRENGFLTYRIFISDEHKKDIIDMAVEKHNLAVDKFIEKQQKKL